MLKFFKNIKDDFLNKKFIPLKILYFFLMGGMFCLFPYLTIHARSLGITESELGIIYAVMPLAGLFGPSFSGLLADKLGNFRVFVSLLLVLSGLTGLLFIAVPVGRIEKKLSEQLPMMVECSANSSGTVKPQLSCTLDGKHSENFINISKCSVNCAEINTDSFNLNNTIQSFCDSIADCELDDSENSFTSPTHHEKIDPNSKDNGTYFLFNNFSMAIYIVKNKNFFNVNESFCPKRTPEGEIFLDSGEDNSSADNRSTAMPYNCHMKCYAFALTKDICKNKKHFEDKNPMVTMISYMFARLINQFAVVSSFTLFESAVIAILTENDGDIGLQRVFGNLGQIVMAPISGILIDSFADYKPVFYMFCVTELVCALFFLRVNLDFKTPSENVLKNFKMLIIQPRIFVFLIFILSNGACYGFIGTFIFWLLEDLGADKILMGISVTVASIAGIPLLWITSFFINKMGYVNTLVLCCLIYVIRLVGYTIIENPWIIMPFEVLEAFTDSLFNVIAMSYAETLSTPSSVSSMQGLLGGAYYGLGKSVGSLIGGVMIDILGNTLSYRIMAALTGATGILYFLINRLFFRKPMETPVTQFKRPIEVAEFNLDSFRNTKRHAPNNIIKKSKLKGRDNRAFND
ncbi:UNVERIFIED_CONTAM: hypothetical protein RMT77_011672 [Armadillidium vulgare]